MVSDPKKCLSFPGFLLFAFISAVGKGFGWKAFYSFLMYICQLFCSANGVGSRMNVVLGEPSTVSMIYDTQ